jgi:hypothetical protein
MQRKDQAMTDAADRPETTSQLRNQMVHVLANILHDIAPPDGQRRIEQLWQKMREAAKREESEYYDI